MFDALHRKNAMTDQTSEQLVELIYSSLPIIAFREADIRIMLEQIRPKNKAMDVTGMLVFANMQFLQVLEGRRRDVNRIFQSITHDARHHEVNLISVRNIATRRFGEWDMAFNGGDNVKKLSDAFGQPDFNVYNLMPDSALELLVKQSLTAL